MTKIKSPLKHKEGNALAHEVGTQWKTEAGWHAANPGFEEEVEEVEEEDDKTELPFDTEGLDVKLPVANIPKKDYDKVVSQSTQFDKIEEKLQAAMEPYRKSGFYNDGRVYTDRELELIEKRLKSSMVEVPDVDFTTDNLPDKIETYENGMIKIDKGFEFFHPTVAEEEVQDHLNNINVNDIDESIVREFMEENDMEDVSAGSVTKMLLKKAWNGLTELPGDIKEAVSPENIGKIVKDTQQFVDEVTFEYVVKPMAKLELHNYNNRVDKYNEVYGEEVVERLTDFLGTDVYDADIEKSEQLPGTTLLNDEWTEKYLADKEMWDKDFKEIDDFWKKEYSYAKFDDRENFINKDGEWYHKDYTAPLKEWDGVRAEEAAEVLSILEKEDGRVYSKDGKYFYSKDKDGNTSGVWRVDHPKSGGIYLIETKGSKLHPSFDNQDNIFQSGMFVEILPNGKVSPLTENEVKDRNPSFYNGIQAEATEKHWKTVTDMQYFNSFDAGKDKYGEDKVVKYLNRTLKKYGITAVVTPYYGGVDHVTLKDGNGNEKGINLGYYRQKSGLDWRKNSGGGIQEKIENFVKQFGTSPPVLEFRSTTAEKNKKLLLDNDNYDFSDSSGQEYINYKTIKENGVKAQELLEEYKKLKTKKDKDEFLIENGYTTSQVNAHDYIIRNGLTSNYDTPEDFAKSWEEVFGKGATLSELEIASNHRLQYGLSKEDADIAFENPDIDKYEKIDKIMEFLEDGTDEKTVLFQEVYDIDETIEIQSKEVRRYLANYFLQEGMGGEKELNRWYENAEWWDSDETTAIGIPQKEQLIQQAENEVYKQNIIKLNVDNDNYQEKISEVEMELVVLQNEGKDIAEKSKEFTDKLIPLVTDLDNGEALINELNNDISSLLEDINTFGDPNTLDNDQIDVYNGLVEKIKKKDSELKSLISKWETDRISYNEIVNSKELGEQIYEETEYNKRFEEHLDRKVKVLEKGKLMSEKLTILKAQLGINAVTGKWDDNYEATTAYKDFNKQYEDSPTMDAICTFNEWAVDTGLKLTLGLGSDIATSVSQTFFEDDDPNAYQYSDYGRELVANYISENMVSPELPRDGSISEGGFTYKNTTKTIAEMLPYTLGVILAASRGSRLPIQNGMKTFNNEAITSQVVNNLNVHKNIFVASTMMEQYDSMREAENHFEPGSWQAWQFATFLSTATALSQVVMPDQKFFQGAAGKSFKKTLATNLKAAANVEAGKQALIISFKNLVRELGEEEIELVLKDVARISTGLSHTTQFQDLDVHADLAVGTIMLAGSLQTVGSVKTYKNVRKHVYNEFEFRGEQTLKNIQTQYNYIENKLERFKNLKNPPKEKIASLEKTLGQLKQGEVQARAQIHAIKTRPANASFEYTDLLVEKFKLVEMKNSTQDKGELKLINDNIGEIDKKIESTATHDQYLADQKKDVETTKQKVKEQYNSNQEKIKKVDEEIEELENNMKEGPLADAGETTEEDEQKLNDLKDKKEKLQVTTEVLEVETSEEAAEIIELNLNEQIVLKNEEIREAEKNKDKEGGESRLAKLRMERTVLLNVLNNIGNVNEAVQTNQEINSINYQISKLDPDKDQRTISDLTEKRNKLENTINNSLGFDGFQSNGFITLPDINGNRTIVINKTQSLKSGYITTGQHEYLHAILNDAVGSDPKLQAALGEGMVEFLNDNSSLLRGNGKFNQRLRSYSGNQAYVETMPLLSEALSRKDITTSDSFLSKMKDVYRQWAQRNGRADIVFNTGEDVFNFIKDYNKTIKSKKKNKAFVKASQEGISGRLVQRAKEKTMGPQFSNAIKAQFSKNPDFKNDFDKITQNPDGSKRWNSKREFQNSGEYWDGLTEILTNPGLENLIKEEMGGLGLKYDELDKFVEKVKKNLERRYEGRYKLILDANGNPILNEKGEAKRERVYDEDGNPRGGFDPSMANGSLFGWLTGGSGESTNSTLYHARGNEMNKYKKEVPTKPLSDEFQIPAGEDVGFAALEEKDMSIQAQVREAGKGEPGRPKTRREEALEGVRFLDAINISPKIVESIKNVVANIGLKANDWKLLRGLDYKGVKNLITPVEKIERKGKKVNPTKAADVKPTGSLFEILNMISSEFGVDARRILANQSLDETQRGAAQAFINEKAQEILDVFPDQHTLSGKATGLTQLILELAYIPGTRAEYSAGATAAGLKLWVKNPKFTAENLKTAIGMDATNKGRDGLIKATIVQATVSPAKSAIKEYALKDESSPFHATAVLDDGASQIYFSKNFNNNGIQFSNTMMGFAQEQRDWKPIIKARGQTMPELGNQTGRDELLSWIFNVKGGNLHTKLGREFFVRSGVFHGTSIASHKDGVTIEKFKENRNNTSLKLFGKPYNKKNLTKDEVKEIKKIHPGKTTQRTINHSNNKMLFRNKPDAEAKIDAIGAEFASMDPDIKILLKTPKHNESKKDKEARARGLKKVLNILNDLVVEDDANIPYVASLLSSISSLNNHWFRNGAVSDFYNTLNEENRDEHQQPASDLAKYLFNRMIDRTYSKVVNTALDGYKRGLLPLKYDNALSGDGFSYKNDAGEFRQGILEGKYSVWIRYANPNVSNNPIMVNDKLTGEKGINFNVIILSNGNSVAQEFGVGVDSKLQNDNNIITKQQDLLFKIFSGKITQAKASTEMTKYVNFSKNISSSSEVKTAMTFSKAVDNSRSINHKTPLRGMSAWDFDDTLATTKSGVRAKIPNPDGTPQPNRKVIFLAGGAGSGKGNVISKLGLENQGFKIVNQDISLEWLKKNNGLPENMNDLTKEQRSTLGKLGHQARGIAKRKMMKYQGNAEGIVVDGTGGSINAMQNLVKEFTDKGYDVSMLFVETSLETALERNAARKERSLLDKMVERNHQAVQNNKSGFKTMFGERFMEVKTDNLTQEDAMPTDLTNKMNDFVSGYKKVRLDAEQFATEGAEILEQGGEFDFTEFDVVTGGEVGPMFNAAMERAKKFGTKDTYVLTARPSAAAIPIQQFLESQGLNIPLENITGLGNSTGEAKAEWMLEKFSEGYNNMFFADDAMQNVEAVKNVLDQLDVKSEVIQAKIQFSKSIDYNTENLLTNPTLANTKEANSINNVKDVDGLANEGVYSSIQFSKKHRGEYENLISKHRPDLVKEGLVSQTIDNMFDYIDSLNIPGNKKRKYEQITTKWLATSNIKLNEDGYKIQEAVELAERYKEDIFFYTNPNAIIEKYAGKAKAKPTDPKTVKEFGEGVIVNKEHGIVEYEVQDTKEGQAAVRSVMDSHFGEKSNPWCLAQQKDGKLTEESWDRWENYSDGPKKIVFQNGKLLSFYASNQYWDRMDNATDAPVIRIKDGRVTRTVELVPYSEGGVSKVQEFVMETRTTSKDKKTVTTEYHVERSLDQEGYSFHPAGTKVIENKVNGITTKETVIKPDGRTKRITDFEKGKEIESRSFQIDGKTTMSINGPRSITAEKHGDFVSHEITDGKVDYWHGKVSLESQGLESSSLKSFIAKSLEGSPVTEIGFKTPSGFEVMDVMKRVDGKLRVDFKKVLEVDPNIKGLPSGIQFSKGVNRKFNDILEQATEVESKKTFSEAQARMRGGKLKFRGIVPASAQDFMGLIYNFIPRGKKGDAAMDFFKKALVDPFARGINELNTSRQTSANDYKNLTKQFPKVKKKLNKKAGETNFTNDQAVRVYLWNKAGFKVPGLSQRDLTALDNYVKNDPELQAFADALGLISKKAEGYSKPGEYWLVENIASDLMSDGAIGDARSTFLAEWQQNADQIFSKENLNKIEAIYGSKFREALEDMLYRMRTGKNRPTGSSRIMNTYMNWVNNSVGAIMFFNIRSAVLQTISATNYINWTDNNPLKAAAAFANQKQFWSDFVYIFNSDYLKQRRSGNRRGVNESELTAAIAGSDNKAKAALAWLLSKGFLPTQIADSFAIASGGAPFYRNRVKSLMKQNPGMTLKQAEDQAWLDFQERTEVSQQSARPDLISQQQANPLGRLILSFQNTPMQYARIINKAARDLANNRGDAKHNISKIIYYGGIAAVLFGALQSAIWAALGDDEEEEFDKKKERIINQMIDSWFVGIGYGGKAITTIKNTIMEYQKQEGKGYMSDHTYTILKLLSFSPPIGSKARKIYSAIQTAKFNKGVSEKRGWTLDNPTWSVVGNVIEGVTNIPLGRISQKMLNVDNAMDSNNEWWERMALVFGWNTWDLDIKDPDIETVKEVLKEEKKVEIKKKQKIKKEEKKKEKEKEEEKIIQSNIEKQKQEKKDGKKEIMCAAVSKSGKRCKTIIEKGSVYCTIHIEVEQGTKEVQCKKVKKDKKRCGMMTSAKSGYCYYHD